MTNAEIQVGEYVRTKNGYIAKIENINDFRPPENKYAIDIQMRDLVFIGEDLIAKNSENIIELIETGDYVNGYLVEAIDYYEDKKGNLFNVLGVVFTDDDFAYSKALKDINIYSIVTREQFQSMKYEVGEDD